MIRRVAAVAVALCLSPAWLCAQSTELVVKTTLANVRKGPSSSTAVIGQAPRGTVLKVTRELGSWVKVAWPDAEDGAGYVHVSVGLIARKSATTPERLARIEPAQPPSQPASPPSPVSDEPTRAATQPGSVLSARVSLPTHSVGLGGRIGGSTFGFGASARKWTRDRIGVQLEASRSALTTIGPGRMTSLHVAPSVLYSLPDRVGDYLWVRPYLGAGANLYRSTLNGQTPGIPDSTSDNGLGFQAFGGGELTFSSVPQFALSADVGYRWAQTPFAGFELGGLGLSVSGHWYFR